jgi:hypothetical protein
MYPWTQNRPLWFSQSHLSWPLPNVTYWNKFCISVIEFNGRRNNSLGIFEEISKIYLRFNLKKYIFYGLGSWWLPASYHGGRASFSGQSFWKLSGQSGNAEGFCVRLAGFPFSVIPPVFHNRTLGRSFIACTVRLIYDMIWCDVIWYDMTWHDMIWYMIWYHDMVWYDIWYMICDIWYDMICYDTIRYDMLWYDMIWYMIWYVMIWCYIFVNCNWVATRWQQYNTHLHTNSTQNNTMKQNTENGTYITIRIHKHNNKNT